jgi:hypothetical protein
MRLDLSSSRGREYVPHMRLLPATNLRTIVMEISPVKHSFLVALVISFDIGVVGMMYEDLWG